jgi:hypothetical protein
MVTALMTATAAHAATTALPTRDQNPLLAGFALPMPAPTRLPAAREWDFAAAFNWSTSAVVEMGGPEELIVDAETRELRLTGVWGWSDRLALRWQLPYRYTGAGVLDSFIDSWHDFFGLPGGNRNILPKDEMRIAYGRDDTVVFDIDSSAKGIGDISVGVAYALRSNDATHVTLAFDLELPTGDASRFTGNEAVDATALIAAEHRFAERWTAYGQAAVSFLGEGELLAEQQHSVLASGLFGIAFDATPGVRFNVQVDAHSPAFDTGLDYLSEAAILTLGGSFRFDTWQLELGVSEDIIVDASPDVVFVFGLSQRY